MKGEIIAEIGNVKPDCKSCNAFHASFGIVEIFIETSILIKQ